MYVQLLQTSKEQERAGLSADNKKADQSTAKLWFVCLNLQLLPVMEHLGFINLILVKDLYFVGNVQKHC